VGSCEPFSGKSALVLGLARHLISKGAQIRFGKPLATSDEAERQASGSESERSSIPGSTAGPLSPDSGPTAVAPGPDELVFDADVRFVGDILGLSPEQLLPSLHLSDPSTARQRLLSGHLNAGQGLARLQALGATALPLDLATAAGAAALAWPIDGAAFARATASATCASPITVPGSKPTMQPFCAPVRRSTRVRRRVSMPAMATVPSRSRYSGRLAVARKFETRRGTSLTISPAAKTPRDSTSSSLTPVLPMCGYVRVTICRQ
jgi:hypothetical protein